MRVAVFSDVHANRPALEAVLDDVPADVERLVCLGDIVGYGGSPAHCVRRVREVCDAVVQGNHDRRFAGGDEYPNTIVAASHRHAREQLDHDAFRWLDGLPRRRRVGDLLLVHSHPTQLETRVEPDEVEEIARHVDAPTVAYGHTHLPCDRRAEGVRVVNPGSVGQPRDGDPRAAYALLDESGVEFRRVEYDVDAAARAIREADIPADAAERLRRGD